MNSIRKALDSQLASLSLGLDIAWPNIGFDPSGAYLRPAWLPNPPDQAELGRDGRNVHEGIYQVDVFYPTGQGVKPAETTAEALVDAFKRGTTIEYAATNVRCDRASYRPVSDQEPNWYRLIVEIDYRAYLPN